jgi:hypothetical protein
MLISFEGVADAALQHGTTRAMAGFGHVVRGARKVGDANPMRLEDEYRKHAADSFRLASKQSDSADKSRLLVMAEAWLDLADRITGRIRKRCATVDHPLVEKVLGHQPRAD